MEFTYVSTEPDPPLRRFVEQVWYARGTIAPHREQIAPTGATVAAFVLGDPIVQTPAAGPPFRATTSFLLGPHDRPLLNAPTSETHCVGIVTTPVGCRAVVGVGPATVRGAVVAVEDGWPGAEQLRLELLALADDTRGASGDELIAVVIEALAARVGPPAPDVLRCEAAVAMLEADPTRPVAEIAAALGISHGHLDREFARVVGLGPRTLARILRLRRLLASIDTTGPVHWVELAARLGWYDQAHLIRDFVRHTGVTPSEYVAAQRRGYPAAASDGDPRELAGPGFVPLP